MTTEATTIATEAAETLAETVAETLAAAETTAPTEAALDIESLKEIMDAFDPAALLPQLDTVFEKVELVCRIAVMVGPIVLLLMGIVYLFFTPREANHYIGYRCYYGMGSVQAWRFTQRIAGMAFGGLGLVLTVVMFFITGGFAAMEMMDMVWKAVRCLIWEAGLAIAATLAVNYLAFHFFDRKGEPRRKYQK